MGSDERRELEHLLRDKLAQTIREQGEKAVAQNILSSSGINVESYQRILKEMSDLKQRISEMERTIRVLKGQVSGARKWV